MAYPVFRNFYHVISKTKNNNYKKIFQEFIGTHTITAPMKEIQDHLNPIINNHYELFDSFDSNEKILIPKVNKDLFKINLLKFVKFTKSYLNLMVGKVNRPLKILEIGSGSGMFSIALKKLGHNVFSLDKGYLNKEKTNFIFKRNLDLANINIKYVNADITRKTQFKKDSFDMIVSISVLEHVLDFKNSLKEMYRLLNKKGCLLHRINPYWCEAGAHALGILDSPWLHAKLDQKEIAHYLKIIRPYEYDFCMRWIKKNLNKNLSISYIQTTLSMMGFQISRWTESTNEYRIKKFLRPQDVTNILKYNKISLNDLISDDITFVAQKFKKK